MVSSYHMRDKMDRAIWTATAVIVLIIIAAVLLTINPTGNFIREEVIKIGALLPLTGNAAIYGESMRQGVDLAVEEINEAGGMYGKRVEILWEDSKGDSKEAVSAFMKFKNNTPAVITAISGVVLSVAPLANEQKIVLLNVGAKNPAISQAGDYVFSNIPNSDIDEKVFASFVRNNLGINRVAIMSGNHDYGIGTAGAFERFFIGSGGVIVAKELYENDATDFRTQLIKIKNAEPEGIFIVGYKEQGLLLKQAYELGIDTQWLAPEGFAQPEILEIAGEAAEGVIYHSPKFEPASQEEPAKSFFSNYSKKFGKTPDIYAANSYDAAKLLAQAIAETNGQPEKIKEWLYYVKDWPSVTGTFSFDENGDVIKEMTLNTVRNDQFVPYRE